MIYLKPIGVSLKSHGKEGRLAVAVEDPFLDALEKARAVFIDLEGSRVPFLIESADIGNKILLKLDEVDTPEEASRLGSRQIFLPADEVAHIEMPAGYSHLELNGFTILDAASNEIGIVESVLERPQQDLLVVQAAGKSFEIPLHEDLILSLDEKARTITFELPEGLIDLNT